MYGIDLTGYAKSNRRTGRFSPVLLLTYIVISIFFLTRLILMIQSRNVLTPAVFTIPGSLLIGFLYDLSVCSYIIIPFVLHTWFCNERMYHARARWIVTGGFIVAILLLLFTNVIPPDFNRDLWKGIVWYTIIRLVIYQALSMLSFARRQRWRGFILCLDLFIVIFILLFNAISEWFFWQEFSVRYNFIAVDYLVYTNEVIGNIKESYPVGKLITATAVIALIIVWLMRPVLQRSLATPAPFLRRTVTACILLLFPAMSYLFVQAGWQQFSKNEYANELAGNGLFDFSQAFWHNQLDFFKFYQTVPDQKAFATMRHALASPHARFISPDPMNLEREIRYPEKEVYHNIVLISVESLDAGFMKYFGNKANITPCLDSLVQHSILFTKLYASGTRTVRGLEALTLSIPPTPGQSIIKRPHNEDHFSLGSVFRSKGYITQYMYGGYGYFDNMNYFFSHNGYDVIDRSALDKKEIHYENIWGVADEDLFTLALHTLDSNYSKNKPFFTHIMTVSNHRPYTYPDNRIDIPSLAQTRNGAVKYTDYSINKFLKESSSKPWFPNTIFIIIADHCAGSAGSVQLPVTGYHIPMLIYAPAIVKPAIYSKLTSQIDVAPTVLGMLNFNYLSKFFGADVLNTDYPAERAFISTYQGLGFIKNNRLIIQSPVKKVKEFEPDFVTGGAKEMSLTDSISKEAIAYYQCASWLLKHDGYRFEQLQKGKR